MKYKEVLMNGKEIWEEIKFEDKCGMNTLLQNISCFQDEKREINVFKLINKEDKNCGYKIRDAKTGEDCQL